MMSIPHALNGTPARGDVEGSAAPHGYPLDIGPHLAAATNVGALARARMVPQHRATSLVVGRFVRPRCHGEQHAHAVDVVPFAKPEQHMPPLRW